MSFRGIVWRRIFQAALVLFFVSILVFLATQTLPGDAAQAILGKSATPSRLAELRSQLHLAGSPLSQYLRWIGGVAQLQFGKSLSNNLPVTQYLGPKIINSLVLMVGASVIGVPVAVFTGALLALRSEGIGDHIATALTIALAALPEFVIGTLLVILLSTGLFHIFPATATEVANGPVWDAPGQLVLPVLTLALAIIPYIVRITRGTMIEILDSEYVQYAKLGGLSMPSVIFRHAIPNAVGAVAQVTALQLAYLAGGVVVVEDVFGYPGIGAALVNAVSNRDLPVIQASCLFIAVFYVGINLVADILTLAMNPRVRRSTH
jgi:peptide/nickel transport system permease protein